MSKAQKARDIIERFPNLSKHKLAELLLKENSLLFRDKEDARKSVRNVTGAGGKISKEMIQSDKYKGVLPQGEKNDFSPFVLKGKRIGIISDVHIPYHDLDALNVALSEFKRVKVDTIVLNGDIIDAYQLSRWEKDPNKRNHAYEMELLTIFFDDLIKMFPKVELVYKLGNHDERYEKFIYAKSPEFIGMHVMSWKHLINLRFENCKSCKGTGVFKGVECPNCEKGKVANNVSRGIHLVKGKRVIKAGKLNIVHAHEFNVSSVSVNPARGFFLKAKTNVIGGHLHRSSEHIEKDLNQQITGAWSTGCLCYMHPDYAPLNNWNLGCADVEVFNDGDFEVHNHKIINGKIK
jgi:predicted phosphodiesterase